MSLIVGKAGACSRALSLTAILSGALTFISSTVHTSFSGLFVKMA